MPFRPKTNEIIHIEKSAYRFTAHPSAQGMPYGQTGRRATVYQMQEQSGQISALKVFTLAFRKGQIAQQAAQIAQFSSLAGLKACRRLVITAANHSALVQQFPDLNYAVLMPWIQGITWQEVVLSRKPLDVSVCKSIAESFIQLSCVMQEKGLAHCDVSGPNVIINLDLRGGAPPVSLIDLEDMFAPGLTAPEKLPGGSAGYAHPEAQNGVWSSDADRFSAAVLLAEILGWCDERVRRIAYGEQFFDPAEVQSSSDRYIILSKALTERWGQRVADCFTQAWFSGTLRNCPSFSQWKLALNPPPDPDNLFSQLLRIERLGRWNEVLGLCDEILRIDSSRLAIWPVRARAQKMLKVEADIQLAWSRASQTGLTADWEDSLRLVNSAQLQAPPGCNVPSAMPAG